VYVDVHGTWKGDPTLIPHFRRGCGNYLTTARDARAGCARRYWGGHQHVPRGTRVFVMAEKSRGVECYTMPALSSPLIWLSGMTFVSAESEARLIAAVKAANGKA
jgi:hypothetical protein